MDENQGIGEVTMNTMNNPDLKTEKCKGKAAKASSNKKRKYNPDAAVIAAVTEETLKSLDLDPQSKDGKMKKRQIRNRMSAQYHRDRKNAYITELEGMVSERNEEIRRLREEVNNLIVENNALRRADPTLTYVHVPDRYDVMNSYSPAVVSAGCTDVDDSDSCSVQSSSCGSTLGQISFGTHSSHRNPTATLTLPSIDELPAFRREIDSFSQSFPGGIVDGWPSQSVDSPERGAKSRGPAVVPTFASSSLTRSLTLISMMCVISLMLLSNGGNSGGASNSLSLYSSSAASSSAQYQQSGSGSGQYLLAMPFTESDEGGHAPSEERRRLSDAQPAEALASAVVIKTELSPAPTATVEEGDAYTVGLAHYFSRLMFHGNGSGNSSEAVSSSTRKHLRSNILAAAENNGTTAAMHIKKETAADEHPQQTYMMRKDLALPPEFSHDSAFRSNSGLYQLPTNFARDFSVFAMSSVVVAEGSRALFDPLMSLDPGRQSVFGKQQRTAVMRSVVPSARQEHTEGESELHSADRALVPSASVMDHRTAARAVKPRLLAMGEQSDLGSDGASDAAMGEQQLFNKLLAESNVMTLQLPLSVVQMGHTWDSSASSGSPTGQHSLDTILSAFNLHHRVEGDSTQQQQSFVFNSSIPGGEDGSPRMPVIELSCMILGAKLVMPSS